MDDDSKELQRLLNFAYFFLKFRPRTGAEIYTYLQKKAKTKHISIDIISRCLEELKKQQLIDDKRFIVWFVESRSRAKPKSVFVIKQELIRLGIEKNLVENYFSEEGVDEESLAEDALKKRWHRFESMDAVTRVKKALSFLAGRGFSYDISKKTIKKLEGGE